jgi:hypothetical protein
MDLDKLRGRVMRTEAFHIVGTSCDLERIPCGTAQRKLIAGAFPATSSEYVGVFSGIVWICAPCRARDSAVFPGLQQTAARNSKLYLRTHAIQMVLAIPQLPTLFCREFCFTVPVAISFYWQLSSEGTSRLERTMPLQNRPRTGAASDFRQI